MILEVKIKKLNEDAVIPCYATPDAAGMDLTATSLEHDEVNDIYIYGTGIAVEIPKGYVGLLFPRSSNRKTNLYLANSVGMIDSDYRGEIFVSFKCRDEKAVVDHLYDVGDRIAQLMIVPYPTVEFVEVDELSKTERGEGGHGHTGK